MWKITHYFSEDQITLVCSTLKKKPPDIELKDYLKYLLNSIKPQELQSNRIVDSGEYWKEQCEIQHERAEKLQNHIANLEKRLKDRSQVSAQNPSTEDEDEDKIPSRPLNVDRRNDSMNTTPAEDDEISEYLMEILAYLNRITEARRSLFERKSISMPQSKSTPNVCRELTEFTYKAIFKCILKHPHLQKGNSFFNKPNKSLLYLVNETTESYKDCVDILTEEYRTIAGRDMVLKSGIIYSLCTFFDKMLNQLHQLCSSNSKAPMISNSIQQISAPTKNDEPLVIGFVANLLIGILRRVDWQQENDLHMQIFEGVLSRILEHVGKLLSVAIFHEQVSNSNEPGNISSGKLSLQPATSESKLRSKYLIHILNTALKVQAEKNMGGQTEELVKKAHQKIRNTLMNSVIGGNLLGLRVPEKVPEEPLDLPQLETMEKYGPEWTIQTVFSMIELEDDEVKGDGYEMEVGGR